MPYVLAIKESTGCVFCEEVLVDRIEPNLVIHRGLHAFVVLNLYPYTTGHLMIVPYRHVAQLADLTTEELEEATALLQKAEKTVERELRTSHHEVGINLGRCAGAGVEGHLHIHLVPMRTDPDPRTGMRAEPPEPVQTTRERLERAWNRNEAS